MSAKLNLVTKTGETYKLEYNSTRAGGATVDIMVSERIAATIDERGRFDYWDNDMKNIIDKNTALHLFENAKQYFKTLKSMYELQELAAKKNGFAGKMNRTVMFN